jgi:peptide-methionine (R)-S-oxide reductase
MAYKVNKTEDQWREELGLKYSVLREAGTDRPWSGALLDEKRE